MQAVLDRWANPRQVIPAELAGKMARTRLRRINLRGVFRSQVAHAGRDKKKGHFFGARFLFRTFANSNLCRGLLLWVTEIYPTILSPRSFIMTLSFGFLFAPTDRFHLRVFNAINF